MKITAFDRKSCREVGDAIEEALKSVGEKFGVSIRRKSGTYSPSNYTLKLEASVVGENGLAISKEAEDFKRFATSYGLKPTDLGRKITNWSGREYQITGLKAKSSKYPILVKEISSGKMFKLPETEVQALIKRQDGVI